MYPILGSGSLGVGSHHLYSRDREPISRSETLVMQHRVQVGLYFYSVTVIEEAECEWHAVAEVRGSWVATSGETERQALSRWREAAAECSRMPDHRE